MTKDEKILFKQSLKDYARGVIEQRMAASNSAMTRAQEAANNEEKSSAGDKYETGRAMGHLEKEMHARQLGEHRKELGQLHAIDVAHIYSAVVNGAFIQCSAVCFFVAAGLGKQMVDGKQVIFLSPQAPLVKLLQGKKVGEQFLFSGVQITIEDVY